MVKNNKDVKNDEFQHTIERWNIQEQNEEGV